MRAGAKWATLVLVLPQTTPVSNNNQLKQCQRLNVIPCVKI